MKRVEEVTTYVFSQEQCQEWADEARLKADLEQVYSFSLDPNLFSNGKPSSGVAYDGCCHVLLNHQFRAKEGFLSVYLHEVAHLIAERAGITKSLYASYHNPFFAALLMMMYRRVGCVDYLQIYDFADTKHRVNGNVPWWSEQSESWMPSDELLISRFTYVLHTSKKLAKSSMSVEQAAQWLRRNDFEREWVMG